MKELLLGCGSRTKKDLSVNGLSEFQNVVRLDNNANHKPDVVWNLQEHPLPFANNEFDEIHAYEVLEHLADQGDYRFFFEEWTEYHRILKPGGLFFGSCPSVGSRWLWGDPSHKRVISRETFVFLSQDQYHQQVGKTSMSDFRYLYKADFVPIHLEDKDGTFYFILKSI